MLAATCAVAAGATNAGALSPTLTRAVQFGGIALDVPTDWDIVDLAKNPDACVRFDHKTIYTGEIGSQQECPAHLVGTTDTLWLHATEQSGPAQRSGLTSHATSLLDAHHVTLNQTHGEGASQIDAILATMRATSANVATPLAAHRPAALATSATGSPAKTPAATARATAAASHTGMGFDQCAAPSLASMTAWLQSPYRSVGIYIGGVNRACAQPNLTPSWVSQVRNLGWGFVPIYVGLQAPCFAHGGSKISTSQASQQGAAAAQDAAGNADALGLGAGSPIYFDLEAYATGNSGCTNAVLAFLSAWASQLHSLGYLAGAYGSMASLMTDLSNNYNNSSYTRQDDVWFAHYNGEQSASDSASFPAFKDSYWPKRRLHQYLGGHQQTWGGVTINIDENWNDGQISGTAVPVDYGANTYGPGGSRFVFTGSMNNWHPDSSQGLKKISYWTNSAGSTESNGATWSPSLQPGLYDIQANIVRTSSPGNAPYSIRHLDGTVTKVIDQSRSTGFVSLGQYRTKATTPFIVHVGDNDPSSTSRTIGVDAMRFNFIAGFPGTPTNVSAIAGDGNATISWSAASDGGSAIQSYTVTASPGGGAITVDGSSTSAQLDGLTNDNAYSFTVYATNAVGDGTPSGATTQVTPRAGAGTYHPLTPARILDTQRGNGGSTLRAGSNQRVQIAGFGGVPFSGVNAVVLSVQALNTTADSYLSLTPTSPSGTSQLNFDAGQQVGGLVQATLDGGTGSVLMRLGAGSADVIFDVLGYYGSSSSGAKEVPLNPTRIFDTTASHQPISAEQPRRVVVAGVGGVPSNATAVVLSAQALNATAIGNSYLSVTPSSPQAISQLNVTQGQHSSGLIITAVGSGGTVLARIGSGRADVIFDVTGYFVGSGGTNVYHPLTPYRAYQTAGYQLTASEGTRTVILPKVPDGATSVMLSLQALNASADSYLSITPGGAAAISELNFPAGRHVSGAAIVRIGNGNTVSLRIGNGSADVILDIAGYYGP